MDAAVAMERAQRPYLMAPGFAGGGMGPDIMGTPGAMTVSPSAGVVGGGGGGGMSMLSGVLMGSSVGLMSASGALTTAGTLNRLSSFYGVASEVQFL